MRVRALLFGFMVLVLGVAQAGVAQAQYDPPAIEWQASFGGDDDDRIHSVIETRDGGFLLGGSSWWGGSGTKASAGYGREDYWVVRLDSEGHELWQQIFGGDSDDILLSVTETSDGGFIIGGYSWSGVSGNKTSNNYGSTDYWVIRLDADGAELWQADFGGSYTDFLYSVSETSDGGFLLSGISSSVISGNKTSDAFGTDYWIVRLDADGNELWQSSSEANSFVYLGVAIETSDGGAVIGGSLSSGASYGSMDYSVIRLDNEGHEAWRASFGGSESEHLYTVVETADGGFILGGSSWSGASGSKTSESYGESDYWMVRLDPDGNEIWQASFGGDESDALLSIAAVDDGGYILGGHSSSDASGTKADDSYGGSDFWLIRIDANGHELWQTSYGGSSNDYLSDVTVTMDGGVILGGASISEESGVKFSPSYGGFDYWIIRLEPEPIYDADGDGEPEATDCDDLNPNNYPDNYEVCDGVENDCDPATADGLDEDWYSAECDGPDTDLCAEGTFQCLDGAQVCSDYTRSNLEACDDLDNDCNPATPDGSDEAQFGAACDGEDEDLCQEGEYQCLGGTWSCSDNTRDNLEACDGVDNDCDPSTPDGGNEIWIGASCDGEDSDLCEEGVFECRGGARVCTDDSGDLVETCNGNDDDCNGELPAEELDPDEDGVITCQDNCPETANEDQLDSDEDGLGDACDLCQGDDATGDSDEDGVCDDSDLCQGNDAAGDSDWDNVCDDLDLCDGDDLTGDADEDGLCDDSDNCTDIPNPDQADDDTDGIGDACEPDGDSDGIIDDNDNCPAEANAGQDDLDADGQGDACDPDDDGDGVTDDDDNCPVTANTDQENNDGDALGDACDLDDDNDGVFDVSDNCAFLPNPEQADTDLDELGDLCDDDDDNDEVPDDVDNCPFVINPDQDDFDSDGQGDLCDGDDDGDGLNDLLDNCPFIVNPDQEDFDGDSLGDACDLDDDGDSSLDEDDNCPLTFNPDQDDFDDDGIGDLCDIDLDGDGFDNDLDNCLWTANVGQDDTDFDGEGDACDDDDDDDGVPDDDDNCPFIANADQTDSDGNGTGDACDSDGDGDGIGNGEDNCPWTANPDQWDFDGDGLGDACDDDLDGDGLDNGDDLCADTEPGDEVDPETGCSIDQLCPCAGPMGTSDSWRNHGQYVSCVSQTSNSFRRAGLITNAERSIIVSEAGSSDCGHRNR